MQGYLFISPPLVFLNDLTELKMDILAHRTGAVNATLSSCSDRAALFCCGVDEAEVAEMNRAPSSKLTGSRKLAKAVTCFTAAHAQNEVHPPVCKSQPLIKM